MVYSGKGQSIPLEFGHTKIMIFVKGEIESRTSPILSFLMNYKPVKDLKGSTI